MRTFFVSDYHAGHEKIISLCNRPFHDIQEMEQKIISNHNSIISDSDTIWNLGDVGFRCSAEHVSYFLRKLNGQHKIILGNHDKPLYQAIQLGLIKDLLCSGKIEIIGLKAIMEDRTISISKMIEIDGYRVFVSHYACRTWPSSFRGCIHLYGHSHNNLPNFYKSMDVGVDANNFTPLLWENIKEEMDKVTKEFSEKEGDKQ